MSSHESSIRTPENPLRGLMLKGGILTRSFFCPKLAILTRFCSRDPGGPHFYPIFASGRVEVRKFFSRVWLYSGQMSHGEVALCCRMWALSTTVQFYPISTSCFVRNLVVFYPLLQQGSQKILVIFTRFLPLKDQASQLVFGGPPLSHPWTFSSRSLRIIIVVTCLGLPSYWLSLDLTRAFSRLPILRPQVLVHTASSFY
ncbi:hypothetical protein F5878DRAFT_87225 [Lentinula raphanica]|uniref:Uncharacterized protein n=1 Tax=Lentinula raphanica TaxID=153919 RepID=A0AA38PC99_9AGAR|nr:hypothetical protein F5878DRAFT_87225 [Lentinula raphanica]